jgi:hypothetical protein
LSWWFCSYGSPDVAVAPENSAISSR